MEVLKKRAAALYEADESNPKRMAHENAELQQLYDEFLGGKNSKKCHELLHTTYTKRDQI
jgi:iron only hydrogenase large subunit-like protein